MKKEILKSVFGAHKNLIVTGDVSTGKTTKVIMPLVDEMIENEQSIVFLDPKEEYYTKYYGLLKDKNYNFVVLNLRDFEKSDGWNPLEYPYELYKKGKIDASLDHIEKIASTICYEKVSSDPFWSLTAADCLVGLILALFEDANDEEVNINSICEMLDLFDNSDTNKSVIKQYFNNKQEDQSYHYVVATLNAPKETKASIISVLKQKIRLYISRDSLAAILSKNTFDYQDFLTKPTAIFVLAKDETKALNSIASIFIEEIYATLLEEGHEIYYNFILDNVDILDDLNLLLDMLSSCISRNVKFILGTRSMDYLTNFYGDYILTLCNMIEALNDEIIISISKEGDFEEVFKERKHLDYPKPGKSSVKTFNIKEYLEIDSEEKTEEKKEIKPTKAELNVEELIQKIDQRIQEIENESKKHQSSDQSVFDVFREE